MENSNIFIELRERYAKKYFVRSHTVGLYASFVGIVFGVLLFVLA